MENTIKKLDTHAQQNENEITSTSNEKIELQKNNKITIEVLDKEVTCSSYVK